MNTHPSEDESIASTTALAILGVGSLVGILLIACQVVGIVVR